MKRAGVALLFSVVISGCVAPSRFEWGRYDQALYAYSKNPTSRDNYAKVLEAAIAQGKARGALAPGLQAELGYIRLDGGDTSAAIALFEAEAASFPESAVYMRRVIAATIAPPSQPAAEAAQPAPAS